MVLQHLAAGSQLCGVVAQGRAPPAEAVLCAQALVNCRLGSGQGSTRPAGALLHIKASSQWHRAGQHASSRGSAAYTCASMKAVTRARYAAARREGSKPALLLPVLADKAKPLIRTCP
jgi:hypothetical protein